MSITKVVKGLDVPLAGRPEQVIHTARPVTRVGVLVRDFVGLKARVLVEPGDLVTMGQPILQHRVHAAIRFVAPASGRVEAVHRGDKRALQSIVIAVDAQNTAAHAFTAFSPTAGNGGEGVRALLLESGLWTAFRTRPFSAVPAPDSVPHAVFVTATDTHPLAPDLDVVLRERDDDFHRGLRVLTQVTAGNVYLCRRPGSTIGSRAGEIDRVRVAEFAGKHPAGTAGYHIHVLDPVHREKTVWHIGAQDVARIGHLFATGALDTSHVIALGGPKVTRPRLLRTVQGAQVSQLVADEIAPGDVRVISGSVLCGERTDQDAFDFLGRFHQQITVIEDVSPREFLGWMAPGGGQYSIWPAFLSSLFPKRDHALTTSLHGSRRAMVPIGAYERVMPMDLMPTHLLRALTVGDVEWAEELGALELDEEDLALCTFVCPGKYEFGAALRRTLTTIAQEQ
jgi:Na+-transporting NADH:ubiquinone oxidoreductase subunit A